MPKAGKYTANDCTFLLFDHIHGPQKVWPSGAGPITLTSGSGAWNLGDFVELIAENDIENQFDIHWLYISDPSSNADYEVVLYAGPLDREISRFVFTRTAAFTASLSGPIQTPLVQKNLRVRAKMMDSIGGSTTGVKLGYHTYKEGT